MYKKEELVTVDVYTCGKLSKSVKFKTIKEAHKFINWQRLRGNYCHMECFENGRAWCKFNYEPITDFNYGIKFWKVG